MPRKKIVKKPVWVDTNDHEHDTELSARVSDLGSKLHRSSIDMTPNRVESAKEAAKLLDQRPLARQRMWPHDLQFQKGEPPIGSEATDTVIGLTPKTALLPIIQTYHWEPDGNRWRCRDGSSHKKWPHPYWAPYRLEDWLEIEEEEEPDAQTELDCALRLGGIPESKSEFESKPDQTIIGRGRYCGGWDEVMQELLKAMVPLHQGCQYWTVTSMLDGAGRPFVKILGHHMDFETRDKLLQEVLEANHWFETISGPNDDQIYTIEIKDGSWVKQVELVMNHPSFQEISYDVVSEGILLKKHRS